MKTLLTSALLLVLILAPLGAGVAFAGVGEVLGAAVGLMSWHDVVMGIFAEMGNVVLTIVSKVLDLAGAVLNFSIELTVNMGEFLNKVKIVEVGWTVFRDLANLFFIFVLLWFGIRFILGLVGGEGKKTLLMVIIMALLINFSLFITKAIVDAGNIATLHFYNAMRPDLIDPATNQPLRDAAGNVMKAGLSDIYMEALKLQTVFDAKGIPATDTLAAAGGFANQFIKVGLATLLGSVFFLVAAFVFFAAGIMFISRAVVLMFLMLLSPLAFVAHVLPNSQAQALGKQWWDMLFKQTFWAPLYMALTYAVAKAIQSGGFRDLLKITENQASFAALMSSPASDNVGIIVNYIILIAAMVTTLLIASSMGAKGSKMMMEWGQKAQGWGMGVLKGVPGGLAARSVGGFARAMTSSDALKASTNPLARAALRTANRLQEMKFGGKSYKEMQEKGTFGTVGDEEVEKTMKGFRNNPRMQAQYLANLPDSQRRKAYEKLSARDRVAVETEGIKSGALNTEQITKLRDKLTPEEKEKTEKEIKKLSKEGAAEALEGAADAIAKALKEALAAGQANPLIAGVKHGENTYKLTPTPGAENEKGVKEFVDQITDKDITKYNAETLKYIAPFLKKSHWKAISEEKENLTPAQKKELSDERMKPLIRALGGGFGSTIPYDPAFVIDENTVKEELDEFGPEDIAGFKNDLKMSPLLIRHYTQQMLAAMAKKGIDDDAAESIKKAIVEAEMAGASVQGLSAGQQSNFRKMQNWLKTSPVAQDNF